jgi:hypothetical protein
MQPHRHPRRAVAEGILEQVGDDLGHRTTVSAPVGQGRRGLPRAALERGRGGGPLQQGGQRLHQELAIRPAEHRWQQQGLGIGRRGDQHLRTGEIADGIDIALQLSFLRQQPLHQAAVIPILIKAAQQQLTESAQRREGIAQLMHKKPQLLILEGQPLPQLLPLPIEAEGIGEAKGHRLEALPQGLRPGDRDGFHLQGTQEQGAIAQGQPSPGLGGHPELAGPIHRLQGTAIGRPVAHRHQAGGGILDGMGHIHHQRAQLAPFIELGELVAQEG